MVQRPGPGWEGGRGDEGGADGAGGGRGGRAVGPRRPTVNEAYHTPHTLYTELWARADRRCEPGHALEEGRDQKTKERDLAREGRDRGAIWRERGVIEGRDLTREGRDRGT